MGGSVCTDVTVSRRLISDQWHHQACPCWQCHSGRPKSVEVRVKYSSASYRVWGLWQVTNISKCPWSEHNLASCGIAISEYSAWHIVGFQYVLVSFLSFLHYKKKTCDVCLATYLCLLAEKWGSYFGDSVLDENRLAYVKQEYFPNDLLSRWIFLGLQE